MKRISFLLVTLALCAPAGLRAQDAATQERLDQLAGRIDTVLEAQDALKKQIFNLSKEIDSLREQASKPTGNYATTDQLNRLADAVKDVDRKRIDDVEKTHSQFLQLRELLKAPVTAPKPKPGPTKPQKESATATPPPTSDKGFEYVIKSGDTLGAIVQAYKEKNIKITVKQIVDANPGLKPERLIEGKKIFIPAPQ